MNGFSKEVFLTIPNKNIQEFLLEQSQ